MVKRYPSLRFVFLILSCCPTAAATFLERAQDYEEWIVAARRRLHEIPEHGYEEYKTSEYIRKTLDELEIPYEYPVALTGVVGKLGEGEPVVALRADMDGLELDETANISFASKHEGRMHACGHDAHVSMLLGAARLLKEEERKGTLGGSVRLIFQPAEETGAGGWRMVEEGALGAAGAVFGLHTTPGFGDPLPTGHVATRPGTVMATEGTFEVTITGRGGHAAAPHQTVDPVVAAAALVLALQTIAGRRARPSDAVVVTVAAMHGGAAHNVIPNEVELRGTFRSLTGAKQAWLQDQIEQLVYATSAAHGCTASIDYLVGHPQTTATGDVWESRQYPATINHPAALDVALHAAEQVVGPGAIHTDIDPVMGSEDFSFYAEKVPGVFMFLGHHNEEKGSTAPNHHPSFKVDEDALPIGAAMHATFAVEWLQQQSTNSLN